jgi:hypothetical protein
MAILMPGRKLRNLPMPLSETPEASRGPSREKMFREASPGDGTRTRTFSNGHNKREPLGGQNRPPSRTFVLLLNILGSATLTSPQCSPWEGNPWPITHSKSRRPCATCPNRT